MNTAEYLARVGLAALLDRGGGPTEPEWADEDDPAALAAASEAARLKDHARVRELLLGDHPEPRQGGLLGAKWLGVITWPDRVPRLVTWTGQQTLPKIIRKLQGMLTESDSPDLFEARAAAKGATGIDALSCQDAIGIGFSPNVLGMEVVQRPGLELLAVCGLETLPLVSFASRECGFIHSGRLWKFKAEAREGGYYHRWGDVRPAEMGD